MNSETIEFVLPLPFGIKIGKGLISETSRDMENPINTKRFGCDMFYVLKSDLDRGMKSIRSPTTKE
jgi:hypothetical protein